MTLKSIRSEKEYKTKKRREKRGVQIPDGSTMIQVKKGIYKEYLRLAHEASKEDKFTVIKGNFNGVVDELSAVFIKLDEELQTDDMIRIGAVMESLKAKAYLQKTQNEKKKLEEKENVLSLHFPKKYAREFKAHYGTILKLLRTVGSVGERLEYQFEVSDCFNRQQFTKRVMEIADAFYDIKTKIIYRRHKNHLDTIIDKLNERCSDFMQKEIVMKRMLGADLIDSGYANMFDIRFIGASWFNKIVKAIFKAPQHKFVYFGEVVNPDKKYVVRLRRPIVLKKPIVMDWEEMIWLQYEYGEQISEGEGVRRVDQYFAMIAEDYNSKVEVVEE